MPSQELTLYHSPQTRSTGVRVLLEELDVPYTLHALNGRAGELDAPAYLAVNPLGKVPAIVHKGVLVTEQPAIYTYLADTFRDKALSPALGDPHRGSFLRWMSFYGSSFEPAAIDRALKRDGGSPGMSPYGTFDAVIGTFTSHLEKSPYFLGDRFSAVDVLWGSALGWMIGFKIVPATPTLQSYVERVTSRPSFTKVNASDAELVAGYEAAAQGLKSTPGI